MKKWVVLMQAELIWLTAATNDGFFECVNGPSGALKIMGIALAAKRRLASEKGICSI